MYHSQVTPHEESSTKNNDHNQRISTEPLFYDPNNEIVNIDDLGDGGKTGSHSRSRSTSRTCLASEPTSTKTLRGGTEAGLYTRHGQVERFEDCIEFCCGNRSCDIAMTINNECYSVACFNRYTCEVIESEENKDVKTLVSLVHQSPTKLTTDTVHTTETNVDGRKSPHKQLSICQHTDINHGMTVRGGFRAGKFTEHGILPDIDACVERCCESLSCDLALVIGDSCFTLKCDSKELCEMVPAQNADYLQPKLIYLKTRAKISDSVKSGVNQSGSSDIKSDVGNQSIETIDGSDEIDHVVPVSDHTLVTYKSDEKGEGVDGATNQTVNATKEGRPYDVLKKLDDASVIQPKQQQKQQQPVQNSQLERYDHGKIKNFPKGTRIQQSISSGNNSSITAKQHEEILLPVVGNNTISKIDLQNANKTLKDLQSMLFMASGNNTKLNDTTERQNPNQAGTRKDLPFSNNFHHEVTNKDKTSQQTSLNSNTVEVDQKKNINNTDNIANNSGMTGEPPTDRNNTVMNTSTDIVQSPKEANGILNDIPKDNKLIAKDIDRDGKSNATDVAVDSKPNAKNVANDNNTLNKTECTPYQIFTNQTLHGGSKAGVFQHQQDITDFDSCVMRCCFHDDCDVALMMADELCFIVTCHSRDACDVEDPVETKGKSLIHSKIAYVRIALLEIGTDIL